jgi:hypothetical protein
MKMIYLLIAILIIGGLIYYFSKAKRGTTPSKNSISNGQQEDTTSIPQDDLYEGLRNLAINLTPDQFQLSLPNDQTKVYGVVMDWDVGRGTATLTSFTTGDASLYLSSGGGMLGGGQHQSVSNAAKSFVDKAQNYLDKTIKTETTPLPDKNCVRFYLLTNKGKFSAQEGLQNFENNSSSWLELFEEGNKVISALRLINENK